MKNPSDNMFSNAFGEVSYMASNQNRTDPGSSTFDRQYDTKQIIEAGNATLEKIKSESIPDEYDAKRKALIVNPESPVPVFEDRVATPTQETKIDQIYSFRAAFSGFLISLVDSAPSEIAVLSLRNFNALARWNEMRTSDASLMMSIGWLQIDNHVPNAPFKVAVRPDKNRSKYLVEDDKGAPASSPLLVVALSFAPKHNSGIVVSFE